MVRKEDGEVSLIFGTRENGRDRIIELILKEKEPEGLSMGVERGK